MGRYYSGDIEGKFMFGVQASNDADFFGVTGVHPDRLEYYFDAEDDMDGVKEGISKCLEELGGYYNPIVKFFEDNESYNDEMLEKYLEVSNEKVKTLLTWFARLRLGREILQCLEDNDQCQFEAEL